MERKLERGVQGAGLTLPLGSHLLPRPLFHVGVQAPGRDAAPRYAVVVGEVDLSAVGGLRHSPPDHPDSHCVGR